MSVAAGSVFVAVEPLGAKAWWRGEEHLHHRRYGWDGWTDPGGVALAAPGTLSPLTGIEVRQKPIRLIDKRFG